MCTYEWVMCTYEWVMSIHIESRVTNWVMASTPKLFFFLDKKLHILFDESCWWMRQVMTATQCSTLQHTATHCILVDQSCWRMGHVMTATYCSTMQHCNTLHSRCRVEGDLSTHLEVFLKCMGNGKSCHATHCNTLQHTATHKLHSRCRIKWDMSSHVEAFLKWMCQFPCPCPCPYHLPGPSPFLSLKFIAE